MSTTKRSKLTLVEIYGHGGKKSNSHVLKDIEPIQRLESQAMNRFTFNDIYSTKRWV